jgi:hypothetical protein
MICLFDLLVVALLLAVVLHVLAEQRARLLRRPPDALPADLCLAVPGPQAPTRETRRYVVGLRAETAEDGVHLEFYLPPNQRGVTTSITHLVTTRQQDKHGTLYAMTTASGGSYLVALSEEHARQVLRTFFAWKNRPRQRPDQEAPPALGA